MQSCFSDTKWISPAENDIDILLLFGHLKDNFHLSDFPPNSFKNVGLDKTVEVLSWLTDLEHASICQIFPFMSITAKHNQA